MKHEQSVAATEVLYSISLVNCPFVISSDPIVVQSEATSVESFTPASVLPQPEVFVNDVFPHSSPRTVQMDEGETVILVEPSLVPVGSEHAEEVLVLVRSIPNTHVT